MRFLLVLLLCASLLACEKPGSTPDAQVTKSASEASQKEAYSHPDISPEKLMKHVKVLSSDEFGGRAPASPGEEKTLAYLEKEFKALGMEPGNNGSFFQDVPLVTMSATITSGLSVEAGNGQKFDLVTGPDAVLWTKRVAESAVLDKSQMVFVGYGIVAPEYDWDDYADVNVKGKTVVILVNDPGYATQDSELFNGNAMTYYGRWTYKFEEAAKQGAAGALVIHETAPAAYPWSVVEGSWTGAQHDLVTSDKNAGRAAIEGWITDKQADQLLQASGSSYAQAKKEALDRGTPSRVLDLHASAALSNTISVSNSKNVLAKITGTTNPDEYVLYMGHWDHLGTDTSRDGDQIYNGAVDNATGTGALLVLAEAFKNQPTAPKRSVIFVAVTAEESGLLGSKYYAADPPVALHKTVAGINMDALNVYGATHNISVVGYGSSQLEDYLKKAASRQQRTIGPEPTPEKGYFYRSDHFNLAKNGVPMLYAKGGIDFVNGGVEAGKAAQKYYTENDYHKPSDEVNDRWDLTGAAEDLQLYFDIGRQIANSSDYPSWYPGNEFKAIRDASLAQKGN